MIDNTVEHHLISERLPNLFFINLLLGRFVKDKVLERKLITPNDMEIKVHGVISNYLMLIGFEYLTNMKVSNV